VFKDGAQYGLLDSDNVDAVKCQEPEPPRLPAGDLDCDGEISSRDAVLLLLFVAGFQVEIPDCPPIGSGPADALIGDVNCDGEITIGDVLLVLMRAGRLSVSLPVGCPPIGVAV
jgi:hypothetical protein